LGKLEKLRRELLRDLEDYNNYVSKYRRSKEKIENDLEILLKIEEAIIKSKTMLKMNFKDPLNKLFLPKLLRNIKI
jgi:DNA repair exonuclease SbcCD ATPase subunit